MTLRVDLKWILLQVCLPLLAPIVLAAVIAGLWLSLNPGFHPNAAIILDLTPWTLVFYSLTLIGSAFLSNPSAQGQRPWLTRMLVLVAAADLVYYALMVVSRHNPKFAAPAGAYYVSVVLVMASIALCYRAR
jgi:hypothetical protein